MRLFRLKRSLPLSSVWWIAIEFFFLLTLAFLPFSKTGAEINILICLSLWILRKILCGEKLTFIPVCTVAYLVFLLAIIGSLTQVPLSGFHDGLRGLLKWLKYLGIFQLSVELFQDPTRARRAVKAFLLIAAGIVANGFYQMCFGYDFLRHHSIDIPGRLVRMQSSFSSPNDLAAFLLLGIPLSFHAWEKNKIWNKQGILYAALFIFLSVALIATLSRSAFLALLISIFLYLVLQNRAALLTFLGSCGALAVLFSTSKELRYNFFGSFNAKDITIGERLRFWEITLRMIQEHPFLGNGINMYYTKFPLFAPASETYRGYAHNSYLQMWSEIGLFGFLAFLIPLFFCLGKGLFSGRFKTRASSLSNALLVGIVAFLIQAFFDTNFYALQASFLFWIFWGMYVGLLLSNDSS